ncbi:hypothetical protein D3C81_2041530 [compost metagenome]
MRLSKSILQLDWRPLKRGLFDEAEIETTHNGPPIFAPELTQNEWTRVDGVG